MISRFGVRTKSGSIYYVEGHSHIFSKPTWYIYHSNKPYFIAALERNQKDRIYIADVRSIDEFIGKIILFYNEQLREDDKVDWHTLGRTTEVVEILHFK